MNQKAVNLAIIKGREISSSFKEKKFYQYLLDNNVAYYYSRILAKDKGKIEKKIIKIGEDFNKKYIRTVNLIFKICREAKIDFLLFKTFKHIPEVVDGDIDLFVREKDFEKFINLLEGCGFNCVRERGLKAACTREGFCKIEPRVRVSFHGKTIFEEREIWNHVKREKIGSLKILRTTIEFDLCYFLLNTLFGPNYLKLYHYLLLRKVGESKIYALVGDGKIKKDLQLVIKFLRRRDNYEKHFPLFIDNFIFLRWWWPRMLFEKDIKMILKIKNLFFFFYAKYGYLFFGHLPFRHNWGITL